MDVFLNLPEFKIQNQILHHLLFHEIYQANQNEMWFKFRESNVRLSVVEFALITGLKCVGEVDPKFFC